MSQERSCRNRYRISRIRWAEASSRRLTLALILSATGFGQVPIPIKQPVSDTIMGFESPQGWVVKSGSPATTVAAATIRTQGGHAFGLTNPSATTTLTSVAIASTEPALSAVGEAGSIFEVDLMPPASGATGSLALAVTCPSRGLKAEVIGSVPLNGLRPSIYNTLKFPIPAAVRSALGGGAFTDLVFAFELSTSPGNAGSSTYLFDNLRAVAISPLTARLGVTVPPNHGGSLRLIALGDAPASASFAIAAVQVPDNFRLAQGSASGTTVELGLGYDGSAIYTCTYDADPADTAHLSYQVSNCTGGVKAGDLVGANFARLTIVGGASELKVEADLARNPIGDLVGGDLIPAMPTYWGKSDNCVPAPVSGKVFTISPGCTAQINEASQISTAYFNKVGSSQAPFNFITAPAAGRAISHGTGLGSPEPPVTPTQTSDTPIHQSGHANPGGDFDAYWTLTGDFNTKVTPSTGNASAHLDVEFGGHVVAFGGDVDVVDVKATADTTSGSNPTSTGSVNFFLFGEQVPGGGSVNASTGFNFNALSASQEFNLPQVDFWIFTVQVGATASATLNVTGSLAATGFNVNIDPQVSMGVHVSGGVNLGIASGEVDAKINLLQAEVPVNAKAELVVNADPSVCDISIEIGFNAKATVSALSGEIDLVASFGPCPFCYTDSYTLVKWQALASTTQTLISVGPVTLAAIPLPAAACSTPITATITVPSANAQANIPYPLFASAKTADGNQLDCSGFTWSVTPAETISGSGCNATLTFTNLGAHTVSLSISDQITNKFGNITVVGSGSETVNVTPLSAGPHIIGLNPAVNNVIAPFDGHSVQVVGPTVLQLTGGFGGATGTVNYFWTLTDGSGHTSALFSKALPNDQSLASSNLISGGTFTVTMKTTDAGGNSLGSASMTVTVNQNVVRQ